MKPQRHLRWLMLVALLAARAADALAQEPFNPEERAFWAFQPPAKPALPEVKAVDWPRAPLDRFVLARLEEQGLAPAAPADKRTLIRRATLDLTGLLPTVAEVQAFVRDAAPDAFAKVVDRLLASPRYGERWGRHWLDVARYADSNGLDENLAYANAYRYRDYVIAAFNADKPFDRFVHEQLAGDLLPASGNAAESFERTTATGFLVLGGKMLAEDDPIKMQMDIIDEQVDTIGRAFLGLTLGCARCHAHKYDPIPQEDYYSLAGIFKSTKTMENFSVVARWQERPLALPEDVARREQQQQAIAAKKTEVARLIETANAELLREARRHSGRYLLAAAAQQRLERLVRQARPLGDDPAALSLPGAQQIEAEEYARGNVLKDRENYGKEIGVLVNRGETPNFVEYYVERDLPGVYRLELRYAAAAARPCKLLLNGRLVKGDAAGKVTGSWLPDSQTWFVESMLALPAGKSVIRLENAQAFPHIDKLLLVPAADFPEELRAALTDSNGGDGGYATIAEFVAQWKKVLEQSRDENESLFALWNEAIDGSLPKAAAKESREGSTVRELLLAPPMPTSLNEFAARYQLLFDEADRAWHDLKATDEGKQAQALPDAAHETFRRVLYDPQGPFALPKDIETHYPPATAALLEAQRDALKGLERDLPMLPEAMAVSDGAIEDLRVHLRGSHLTLGAETPRQFPRILAGERQAPIGSAQRWDPLESTCRHASLSIL